MHFITGMYSPPLYITTCHARDGVSNTQEHSNHIYLPSSSLIGDPDTVAWLRAARCTGTRPHRASQAAIGCTASLHRTPPFQAAKSKALLVLSGRGAAVALVAARQDLGTLCARTAHAPTFGPKRSHAEGPRACDYVLGFCRRPPCRPQSVPRIKCARASKGVKRDRTQSPLSVGVRVLANTRIFIRSVARVHPVLISRTRSHGSRVRAHASPTPPPDPPGQRPPAASCPCARNPYLYSLYSASARPRTT